jgi:hypothetical protein
MRRLSAHALILLSTWAAVVWLLGMVGAIAVEPPILDASAMPNLSASGRADYGASCS